MFPRASVSVVVRVTSVGRLVLIENGNGISIKTSQFCESLSYIKLENLTHTKPTD